MATITEQTKKLTDTVTDSAHKIWLAGLGTVDMVQEEGTKAVKQRADQMVDESTKLFDKMVQRGRGIETKGKKEIEKVTTKANREVEGRVNGVTSSVDKQITDALHRFGIPTRKEIQTLTSRVEELNAKVTLMVETQTAQTAAQAKVEAKATTPKTEPARKVYHVTPADEGWKVMAEGNKNATSVHGTKDEALTAAREIAKNQEPSQVVVHKMDGTIQNSFTYGEA